MWSQFSTVCQFFFLFFKSFNNLTIFKCFFFLGLRKQSQKGRISTIEAVIMAMEELKGLGGKVSSQEISILRSNLKTMISEVRSLINLKPIEYAPEEDDDDDDVDDEEN